MPDTIETTQQPLAKPANNGQKDRNRGAEGEALRNAIGKDKILTEEQRKVVLERNEQGTFKPRSNKGLRNALGGEENILSEEQRSTTLTAIKDAILKFFKAGVSRAAGDETPKRQNFASKILGERKNKETSRKPGE